MVNATDFEEIWGSVERGDGGLIFWGLANARCTYLGRSFGIKERAQEICGVYLC